MYFDENEPQDVRDRRLAAERAERRARRQAHRLAAPVVLTEAHFGAGLVAVVLVVLAVVGQFLVMGVVGGAVLLLFVAALVRARVDGDRGGHAVRRAYRAAFIWAEFV
ncbi:hypothetical protein ACWCXC_00785 [Streptomyces sp. NPDC001515]